MIFNVFDIYAVISNYILFQNVHPTFLRTVPPYFHQADVWLELLKHYGWKKVIFIHSMDEEGRMILSRFQALAEKEDISVSNWTIPLRVDVTLPWKFLAMGLEHL